MKQTLFSLTTLAGLTFFMSSCGSKTETVETTGAQTVAEVGGDAKTYTVLNDETTLNWTATEKMGGGHNGKIKVSAGKLEVLGNEIKAGKFDIDMQSIQVEDVTDPQKNAKLVGHLKNDDFFSVDKFAVSTFEITAVEKAASPDSAYVDGNLTIKGITKNIRIPAKVSVDSVHTNVWADFSIDRTEWDIKYKSGKLFPELGDKAINDAIQFSLVLKASK